MFAKSPRRYLDTIRHLQPEQLRDQVGRRVRRFLPQQKAPRMPADLGFDPSAGPRVGRCRRASPAAYLDGVFRYWGVERCLNLQKEWLAPDLGDSWNYPVHYWEELPAWAEKVARDPSKAASLEAFVSHWIQSHPYARGLAWQPYPTAVRIVNGLDVVYLLGSAVSDAWRQVLLESLYRQSAWLSRNLERHLLGTHLLKDLKALLITGACFKDRQAQRWQQDALRLFRRELEAQFQADGSHVEPSLMYHHLALEDLLDLLNFPGLDGETSQRVRDIACKALEVAVATATPDGTYPMHGDAFPEAVPPTRDLVEYAGRLGLPLPQTPAGVSFFAQAGVAAWRSASQYLLADVGAVGPPHLPGHGHCDTLSFEWHVKGVPIVVDAGTFTYEPGALRQACRSTRAHNTLEVDGREQHEIWAAFRVARRSQVRARLLSQQRFEAEWRPWFNKRLRVGRQFGLFEEQVELQDYVEGPGRHRVVSRFHFHPDCDVRVEGNQVQVRHRGVAASLDCSEAGKFTVVPEKESGSMALTEDGARRANAVLRIVHEGSLPFRSRLRLCVD